MDDNKNNKILECTNWQSELYKKSSVVTKRKKRYDNWTPKQTEKNPEEKTVGQYKKETFVYDNLNHMEKIPTLLVKKTRQL